MSNIGNTDFLFEVAKGNIPGHSLMAKFGENPDLPNTGAFEDIWDGGGTYVPPVAAVVHDIASDGDDEGTEDISVATISSGSLTTIVKDLAPFGGISTGTFAVNDTTMNLGLITGVTTTTLTMAGGMRNPNSGLLGVANSTGDAIRVVGDNSTGASMLHILGTDASFLSQEEFVIMPTTTTPTVGLYSRIHRMRSFSVDNTDTQGTLTATTDDVATTVSAQIIASNNQTLMAIYTVPSNQTGYIYRWWGSMSRSVASSTSQVHLRGGALDGFGYLLQTRSITTTGTSTFDYHYEIPVAIPGGSDIWVEANSNVNAVGVSAGFDILLVDN